MTPSRKFLWWHRHSWGKWKPHKKQIWVAEPFSPRIMGKGNFQDITVLRRDCDCGLWQERENEPV